MRVIRPIDRPFARPRPTDTAQIASARLVRTRKETMSIDLRRERAYYLAHQDTLAQLYGGKFVVIKGDVVLGTYDEVAWAAPQTRRRYAGGAFLVQKVDAAAPAPAR